MAFRILLSAPDVGFEERNFLLNAFDSGWVAPVGPDLDAFELEMAQYLGESVYAVALSSGTAALHLSLLLVGVKPGDEVLCPTLTFAATANAISYVGASPVFIDVDPRSWTLDPELVGDEVRLLADRESRVGAIVPVDLYGQCADYDAIAEATGHHDVPVVEDAAEALGASYKGAAAGTLGDLGVLSFNGNKIITTSGGGMLLTRDPEQATRARYLATQAREPAVHYEHLEVGFNYRLSNLLAALGRAQLRSLPEKVERRRAIFELYRCRLETLPGVGFQDDSVTGLASRWLTCMVIDPAVAKADRETVRLALADAEIEARPVWKPMHLQPAYRRFRAVGGDVAERLFETGLCLPSGSALTTSEVDEVASLIEKVLS